MSHRINYVIIRSIAFIFIAIIVTTIILVWKYEWFTFLTFQKL